MSNHNKILFFVCIFSVFYSLFFIAVYNYPTLGDEKTYYTYGLNLYNGHGYSYKEIFPFLESNLREPGYPFFIFGLFKGFGISKSVIQISQAILNGCIILLTFNIANILFNNKKLSLIAASLTSISPAIAGYSAFIISEILGTIFLMLLVLFFLLLLKKEKRNHVVGLSILVGFFSGCLVLTKMIYILFPFVICFTVSIIMKGRIKYKTLLCIVVVFATVLLPWFAFNSRVYGDPFFLTNRGGMGTTIKAERLKWTPKEIFVSLIYPVSEGLVKKYFPDEYKKVTYNYVEGSAYKAAFDRYDSFISQGYGEMAADKQLRSYALNAIKMNVPKYVFLSLLDFHFMIYFEGMPLSQFTDFFKRNVRVGINLIFKIYSLIIIFFSIKGIVLMMKNKEDRFSKVIFLLPIFYTFFMYSAIFGAPRFTFLIIPFIYILASITIYRMIELRVSK